MARNCGFEINGVPLNEQQTFELQMQALQELEQERRSLIGYQGPVNSSELVKEMQKVGAINLKKWNNNLRVPRGRFASNLVEQRAIIKLKLTNNKLKSQYNINSDVFQLVKTDRGFNVRINQDAVNQANKSLEDAMNQPFNEQQIESKMNDLLFIRSQLNGHESYDVMQGEQITKGDNVMDKTDLLLSHRRSLAQLAKSQLSIVISRLKTMKPNDQGYNRFLEIRKDLELRLQGSDPIPGEVGIKGLMQEIDELESVGNKRQTALTFIARDIARLPKLLKQNSPQALAEARMILSVFDAYRNALNTESSENPIFTIAEMSAIKGDPNSPAGRALIGMYNYMNDLSNSIEKSQYRTILRNHEEKMIQDVVRRDEKLRKLYGDDNLTYAKMFKQTMADISLWDATMMDGVTGTFSDLGPVPQLQRNLLKNLEDHYKSLDTKWKEKMDKMQPAVEAKLKELGYGLGVYKMFGASYRLFRQKDSDGELTTRLVSRESHKYQSMEIQEKDRFYKILRTPKLTFKEKQAALNVRNMKRRKNSFLVDPRKLTAVKSKFPEFSDYFVDDADFDTNMKLHLKTDKAYNRVAEEAIEQIQIFAAERKKVLNDLLLAADVSNYNDLDIEDKRLFERFEAQNNPFLAAQTYMKAEKHKFGETTAINTMDKFNTFIPLRYKTADTLRRNSLGEVNFLLTGDETGYYDSNYETIEESDVLAEFYDHVVEVMDTCAKMLPPSMQDELMNRAFLGVQQTISEIALDRDVHFWLKVQKGKNHILDKWKDMWQTEIDSDQATGIRNPFNKEMNQEVRTRFVNTNKKTINRRFSINANMFISSLNAGAKTMLKEKGDVSPKIRRTSTLPLAMISNEGIMMLSKWLNTENSISAIKEKLGLTGSNSEVAIGRIIDQAVTTQVAASETFNLPKMLKLYSLGATTYAAKNEAKPILELIKNHYKNIAKAKLTVDGRKKLFKKAADKTMAGAFKDEWKEVADGEREYANIAAERWYRTRVLNDVKKSTYGVINTDTSHLKTEELESYNEAQAVIDRQMKLPESERDYRIIEEMQKLQEDLGKRYSVSAAADAGLRLSRFVGLAVSVAGATGNYVAGKISNMVAAGNSLYFSESSLYKAERIILASHAHIGKFMRTGTAKKTALLMARFRVFQDATDEIYKNSIGTAVKLPTVANPYFMQQKVEYVNQAPVLVAMMLEQKITGKDGTVSNIWDAMDNDGNLKENFNTDENRTTWERADSTEFSDFKSRVDGAIKNIHGDYTELGSPLAAGSQIFRAVMMFKRWQIRYIHQRFAVDQNDSELNMNFRGRYRSVNPATGMAVGALISTTFLGLGLGFVPLSGALLGGIVGLSNQWGTNRDTTVADTLKNAAVILTKTSMRAVFNPLNIASFGFLGQSLMKSKNGMPSRTARMLRYKQEGKDQLDVDNINGVMTSTSLVLSSLLMRMIFMYMSNAIDREEDEEEKNRKLFYLINLTGRIMQEITAFINPVAMYKNLTSPAALRLVEGMGDLAEQITHFDETYITGPEAGKNKFLSKIRRNFMPSILRADFGMQYAVSGIRDEFITDILFEKNEDIITKEITQLRSEIRNQLAEEMYDSLKEEEKQSIIQQVMEDEELSERQARKFVDKKLNKIFKEEADNILSRTTPEPFVATLAQAKRFWGPAIAEETRQNHPDLDEGSSEFRDIMNRRLKEVIKENIELNKKSLKNKTLWKEASDLYDETHKTMIEEEWGENEKLWWQED